MQSSFKKRVLFVGIPDMAYVCLDGLHMSGVNIVGVMGAKKDHATYHNFRKFVESRNLNFIEYEELDSPEFIQRIKDLNADVAVVCSFNYKVPKVLLEAVKDGFINVHPSLLPAYRGANPYSTVIINGETHTGVTLHFMDENFDTGDVIAQHKLPISESETMGTLFNRLNLLSFNMLFEALKEYEKNSLPRFKQPDGEFVSGALGKSELYPLDFNKSARELERFIRALNPFLIAGTIFRKNLVKVYSAEVIDEKSEHAPGIITKIEDGKFYVSTSEGLLAITSMQFGSFFTGTSKEFIEILDPKVGESFE